MLSVEQVAEYQEWFDNRKHLRELIGQLENLAVELIEAIRIPVGDKKSTPAA